MVDLPDPDAGALQTMPHGQPGETGRVLHAVEALFFDRGDDLAVAEQHCGCVAVIGVDPQDIGRLRHMESASGKPG